MKLAKKANQILMLTVLSSVMVLGQAFAQQRGDCSGWGMSHCMKWGGGMGWCGMIFMIVLWALVIVGLVLAIRWFIQTAKEKKDVVHGSSRALDILNERYARGEVSKEEFDQMKNDLLD